MTREKLLHLIKESRELVKTASPEQKIKLLKLIKESYQRLKESSNTTQVLVENEDDQTADYLQEK